MSNQHTCLAIIPILIVALKIPGLILWRTAYFIQNNTNIILPCDTRRTTSELLCRTPATHFWRQIKSLETQNWFITKHQEVEQSATLNWRIFKTWSYKNYLITVKTPAILPLATGQNRQAPKEYSNNESVRLPSVNYHYRFWCRKDQKDSANTSRAGLSTKHETAYQK